MTDLEKQIVREAIGLLDDKKPAAAQALLEIVVADVTDELMQTNFLAHRHKGGERHALKLIESNIHADGQVMKYNLPSWMQDIKPVPYIDVYEDKK